MQYIINFSIVFLAAVGALEVIRVLLLIIFSPNKKTKYLLVLPLFGHIEEVEYILRNAATRARLIGGAEYTSLIILDCGMDNETRALCSALCRELDFFMCTKDEFEKNFILR